MLTRMTFPTPLLDMVKRIRRENPEASLGMVNRLAVMQYRDQNPKGHWRWGLHHDKLAYRLDFPDATYGDDHLGRVGGDTIPMEVFVEVGEDERKPTLIT